MSITKLSFTFIAILLSQIFSMEWIQDGTNFISTEKIVIKFHNAPELGLESPIELKSRSDLQRILANYSDATLNPTFSNYKDFTPKHRSHDLHTYYNLQFNKPINIFKLKDELENIPDIIFVEFNYRKSINTIPNDANYSNQWAHNNIGQAGGNAGTPGCDIGSEQAWDVTTGNEDVVIAILDTGVNNHSEFSGRLLQGYDFIGNDTNPSDGNGHGTACAGISAAKGNNGVGVAGIYVGRLVFMDAFGGNCKR